MKTEAPRQQQDQSVAVQARESPSTAPGMADARASSAEQHRLQALADGSIQVKRLESMQEMASGAAGNNPVQAAQRRADGGRRAGVVQKAVSYSGVYSKASTKSSEEQSKAIDSALNTLDALVPTALAQANAAMTKPPGDRTPSQNLFAENEDAKSWGMCVEEQLNALDSAWEHQKPIRSARPDYYQDLKGMDTYADLTTDLQARGTGAHITNKLGKAAIAPKDAVGADITYPGLGDAPPPPPLPAWLQAALEANQRHRFAYGESDKHQEADYNEWATDNKPKTRKQIMGMSESRCRAYVAEINKGLGAAKPGWQGKPEAEFGVEEKPEAGPGLARAPEPGSDLDTEQAEELEELEAAPGSKRKKTQGSDASKKAPKS